MAQEYLPAPSNVRLADLMKEHNISQPELAKEIGCSKSTISRFISGAKGMLTQRGFFLPQRRPATAHVSAYSQCRIPFCYTCGFIYVGCGVTAPHNSLARYDRQGLRR